VPNAREKILNLLCDPIPGNNPPDESQTSLETITFPKKIDNPPIPRSPVRAQMRPNDKYNRVLSISVANYLLPDDRLNL
jgi:hypothetical protein